MALQDILTSDTPNDGRQKVNANNAEIGAHLGKVPVNAQTGTSYTLQASDAGALVTLDNGNPVTLTVPTNASVPFDVGATIALAQLGSGTVTVQHASGVTIISKASARDLSGAGAPATLTKLSSNTWLLSGSLA